MHNSRLRIVNLDPQVGVSVQEAMNMIQHVYPGCVFYSIHFNALTYSLVFVLFHESFEPITEGKTIPPVGGIETVNNLPTYIPVD